MFIEEVVAEAVQGALPRIAAAAAPSEAIEEHCMNAEEVATYLGLGINRIYELAYARSLPHRKSGNRFIFRRQDVIEWEERDVIGGGPRPLGRRVG